jgi:DNA-binding SARP family transcriptional activator/tetratricopeptide (TPR) repeat protein
VRVEIGLFGGFTVSLNGTPVPADRWRRRGAAALVKLLALAPGGRLHRDRVLDALWPDLDIDTGRPRLHKAAHHARQALGQRDAIVLRDETVALFPAAPTRVDVAEFNAAAEAALRPSEPSAEACAAALALLRGELLPEDLHLAWLEPARHRIRIQHEQLLRGARRWTDLLRLEPADEQAHLELLREAVAAGDRTAALRQFDSMQREMHGRLGVGPGREAVALREQVTAAAPVRTAADNPTSRPRPAVVETLMERDDELVRLQRIARAVVRTGRGTVVLITGEAGSGKSALTRVFLERVADDLVVAAGGCDDLLAPRSLAPFRDMALGFPELAGALGADSEPEDVLPALLRFASARPTLVVVEDVHWADDVTLDAIRYLSRRIAGIAAILLLTFRPEDVDPAHPLRGILGGLSGGSVHRIEPAPLSVAAIQRLGGGTADEATEIHRVTRGNPLFVTEVIDAGGESVPATVRDAVLARVARLPPAVRRFTERLAVVPSRTERWLAEAIAGDDPAALVHAERSGIVSGGTEYLAFRHELARRAIETSLTVGELVQANREVLDILLRASNPEPARIVHHAEQALRRDVLGQYGPVAADEAQRAGAHRQAVQTIRVVLEHGGGLTPVDRAGLLTRCAYSLYVINDYDAALACGESAVSAAEATGDRLLLADALIVLARIVMFARGPVTARHAAERAVGILDGLGDNTRLAAGLIERARAHSNLATLGIVAQPSPEAVGYAEHALALCDRLDRDDLRLQALCYLGSARLAMGDSRGSADIERAIAIGATQGPLETRVRTYVNAAGSAYRAGRLSDAQRYVVDGLQLAADGEFAAGRYRLRLTAAAVDASAGAWDQAIERLRTLTTNPGGAGVMAVLAGSLLARLLARRGDPDCAGLLAQAQRHPAAAGDSYVAGPIAAAQVEVGWLTGTLRDVPAEVAKAVELATASGHTAMLGELCRYLGRAGLPVPAGAGLAGPWAAAAAGRWRVAAAEWERLGERYERAVELVSQGEDEDAAVAGRAMLAELGADATIQAIDRDS